ncbi:MAG: helix-turn-helix transcriptional regulator [Balneola sp.]
MSLGSDLETIRKEKNLSLEDIFEITKIPVHTLNSIEKDTLFKSSTESKTYLRSFVRSYAKALKIADAHILAALESTENETYDHDLIKLINPETLSEAYSLHKDKVEVDTEKSIDPEEFKADTYQEEIDSSDEKIVHEEPKTSRPTVDTVNWADMSKKVYASPANSKIGLLLILILIVGGLGTAAYFYGPDLLGMFSSDQPPESANSNEVPSVSNENELVVPIDSTTVNDATQINNETQSDSIVLPETLTVVLYAAYEKLEPVRVTSDFNNRTNPFWMDQGEAYYFDFADSLRIRGQYSRFLLMYNGNVINNPRQNYFDPAFDSIVLTREILSAPEYQQNSTGSFPPNLGVAAPDSIIYRIQF